MQQDSNNHKKNIKYRKILIIVLGIAVLFLLLNFFTHGKFFTINNILTVMSQSVVTSFIAWGLAFIFISGISDLSVGAVLILGSNICGILGNMYGYPGLIAGGLITAVVLLMLNSFVFIKTRIPSWIASLAMGMLYESAASFYSKIRLDQGLQVVELEQKYSLLAQQPYILIFWLIGFIIAYFLFNRTSYGWNLRSIGTNPAVSRMMGINIKKVLIVGALFAGIFIGVAAILNESYEMRTYAKTGLGSISKLFKPLATVLLAQAFQGYINITLGVLIGSFFISAIFNVLTILMVPSGTLQEVTLGCIILLFAVLAQRKEAGVVK